MVAGQGFGLNPAFLDKRVVSDLFPDPFISASSFLYLTIIARDGLLPQCRPNEELTSFVHAPPQAAMHFIGSYQKPPQQWTGTQVT